jgi:hypothetical protein
MFDVPTFGLFRTNIRPIGGILWAIQGHAIHGTSFDSWSSKFSNQILGQVWLCRLHTRPAARGPIALARSLGSYYCCRPTRDATSRAALGVSGPPAKVGLRARKNIWENAIVFAVSPRPRLQRLLATPRGRARTPQAAGCSYDRSSLLRWRVLR